MYEIALTRKMKGVVLIHQMDTSELQMTAKPFRIDDKDIVVRKYDQTFIIGHINMQRTIGMVGTNITHHRYACRHEAK